MADTNPTSSETSRKNKLLPGLLAVVALLIISYFFFIKQKNVPEDKKELITSDRSIAVLPFVNISQDAEQEYFSDGITEGILNSLAHLQGLKVTARTSSFKFRGKDVDI